ncbi:hypothetical protein H1P_110011 [Hyella patelloides LEGE 07179]|uniref:Uncharacterized protein n=1 Tax=Hyella patelloides LEGE 07179 TaxID=945734 RepID=A0A563VJI2_9CYAN|nr:hypothetical protein H1P_110011 [Hyella patelloides LEGE 07179]
MYSKVFFYWENFTYDHKDFYKEVLVAILFLHNKPTVTRITGNFIFGN